MSAQGAGGAAEQNPGQGARPAQQVQGILSLVPAGPQPPVPAAAQRRGGGRPRGALNQSTRRANVATARSAAFLGSFLAAASAPPRDLAEEGLAAAAGALYAKEGVDIEEGHAYSEEELRGTFSRAEAREVVNTMEAMMRRIEADDAIAVRKQREHELEVEEEETAAPRAHSAWREVDIKRARALWDANPGASSTDIAVLFNAVQGLHLLPLEGPLPSTCSLPLALRMRSSAFPAQPMLQARGRVARRRSRASSASSWLCPKP